MHLMHFSGEGFQAGYWPYDGAFPLVSPQRRGDIF